MFNFKHITVKKYKLLVSCFCVIPFGITSSVQKDLVDFLEIYSTLTSISDFSDSREALIETQDMNQTLNHNQKSLDLIQTNLSDLNLKMINLKNACLIYSNLKNTNLTSAKLNSAQLIQADLTNSILINADLSHADLSGANLRGANLRNADLSNANLTNADLTNADLSGAKITEQTKLTNVTFKGTKIMLSKFNTALKIVQEYSTLVHTLDFTNNQVEANLAIEKGDKMNQMLTNFEGRLNLIEQDLSDLNLKMISLQNADLQNANLANTNLIGADLSGANLQGANLQGANLQNANLKGANLQGVDLSRTNLRGANLTNAKLPTTARTNISTQQNRPYRSQTAY